MREYAARRRVETPKRWEHLKYRYGIDYADYLTMSEEQNGQCAICGVTVDPLHVDHCHETGVVRGLLCGPCNTSLGGFKDDPSILQRAIAYLDKFYDRPDCDEQLVRILERAYT